MRSQLAEALQQQDILLQENVGSRVCILLVLS